MEVTQMEKIFTEFPDGSKGYVIIDKGYVIGIWSVIEGGKKTLDKPYKFWYTLFK
jgi:hypothetical protein